MLVAWISLHWPSLIPSLAFSSSHIDTWSLLSQSLSCRVMELMDLGVLVGRAWCQGNHDVVCTNIAKNQDGARLILFYHKEIFIEIKSKLASLLWHWYVDQCQSNDNSDNIIISFSPLAWHKTRDLADTWSTWDIEAKVCKWSCVFSEWIILLCCSNIITVMQNTSCSIHTAEVLRWSFTPNVSQSFYSDHKVIIGM